MLPFGGWDMPLSYGEGTIAEHRACRTDAVAFDVSHLGTVRVVGPGSFDALQAAFTNDLAKVGPGRAQYTHLLDSGDASVLDDIIVWWRAEGEFDVMPNASNTSRVVHALSSKADGLSISDVTADRVVVAVQGPNARARLVSVSPEAAASGRFRVGTFTFGGEECVVAGTGYTGEDGVECAVPNHLAASFWDALLGAGISPAGLGARDTLRLEAGLPLHGHELGPGISTLEAGLGWVVSWTKGEFLGRTALDAQRTHGVPRRLVGIALEGRQPAREGATVLVRGSDQVLGSVTSGNFSPILDHAIALALVANTIPDPEGSAGPKGADVTERPEERAGNAIANGLEVELDVRGRRLPGRIVTLPFVAKH